MGANISRPMQDPGDTPGASPHAENPASPRPGATAGGAIEAARIVLARCHYMTHGIRDGVQPLCAPKCDTATATAVQTNGGAGCQPNNAAPDPQPPQRHR